METPNVPHKIQAAAIEHAMFLPGQTVVVGVSGGPDSAVLLHALAGLRGTLAIELMAAHLNHGFRGAEAEEDAAYTAELARSLNIPCRVEKQDVPARRVRQHLSAQEAARTVRHEFLRRMAEEIGAERIALGHTQDDRIETVLLNLLRGTGMEGLQGIAPVALPLVRPLYHVSRVEVEAYCTAFDLQPRRDSSNTKQDYRRNRVRLELLPHLAAYYNQDIGDALLRMSELVSADNAFMEAQAREALAHCVPQRSENALLLKAASLLALPLALQRRVVRQAIAQVRGSLHDVGFAAIENALRFPEQGRDFAFLLPESEAGTVQISGDRDVLQIALLSAPVSPLAWRQVLHIPGETRLENAGGVLNAHVFAAGKEAAAWIAARYSDAAQQVAFRTARLLGFALHDLKLPLLARSWQAGDRMRPRGLNGTKKLQDIFTDAKIPAVQRGRLPIVQEAGEAGEILAVIGLRTGARGLTETQIALHENAVCLLEWHKESNYTAPIVKR